MTLKTIIANRLAKLTIEGIKDVATLWSLDPQTIKGGSDKKQSKRELINSVANSILDKGRLRKVVSALSEREKQILGLFILHNWMLESIYLYKYNIRESELGVFPSHSSSYYYSYYRTGGKNTASGLLGLLLLVTIRKYGTYGPVVYVVPEGVRGVINAEFTLGVDQEIRISRQAEIKDRVYDGYALLEDISQILAYAADGIVLTPAHREIPKRRAEKITNLLRVQTEDRLNTIIAISTSLKLVRETFRAGKPTLVATARAEEFLKQSREKRVMILLAEAMRFYDPLDKLILVDLKELEADVWYDRAIFSKKIGNTLFQKRDEKGFAIYHIKIPKIFAHLRLLGLLEAGKIGDSERDAFLLKPSFFGLREVDEERVKGIIVQPTFEIVALPETPEDVLFNLSRFSELKVADKVHIFTLTKKTLLNAIDKGMNAKKIIALLQNNAKTEIPQNVLYSIEEWSKLYGTVGLKKGVFLDADPELMQVMKKKMKEHLIKEISDSSVIIDREGVLSSLMKEEAGVFIEAVDEIAAAEVEKAIRKYVLRKPSEKVFVIEAENIEKCRTALKKKGIFPKDFVSEEKQMEETACESRNFRR